MASVSYDVDQSTLSFPGVSEIGGSLGVGIEFGARSEVGTTMDSGVGVDISALKALRLIATNANKPTKSTRVTTQSMRFARVLMNVL
jgi:hypothetical protein